MRRKSKKKEKPSFFCTDCGREEAQWSGRCPACSAWDTMREAPKGASSRSAKGSDSYVRTAEESKPITELTTDESPRFQTGSSELDRVLGGGLVRGSVSLLGGEPGVGKSTLLLQLAVHVARQGGNALYASGEESPRQVRLRAERTDCCHENLLVFGSTDVDAICQEAQRTEAKLLVVDSIQTVSDDTSDGVPGSPSQIRGATLKLLNLSKTYGIATIVVGHITKEGEIAGPKLLEHMVDTVLSFEGDPQRVYRFLRAVKNRFGAVSELGVFVMEQAGLQDVDNPSALFIHRKSLEHSGACLAPVVVGSRSYVVEVQALVTENNYTYGRRIAQGYDLTRLNLIISVIEKRLSMGLGNFDVCINVTGGLQVKEPALDLAVAVAIVSSYRDDVVPEGTAWSGEIGLSGEIRPVYHLEQRADEAKRVGCTTLIKPEESAKEKAPQTKGLEYKSLSDLTQALDFLASRC